MISKSIELSVQNVHRASIETEVIPKYEKATREMFRQISETFTTGTDAYIKRFVTFPSRKNDFIYFVSD